MQDKEKSKEQLIRELHELQNEIEGLRKAEKVLEVSEQTYRNLVESMTEGIGKVDADENFIFVNQAAAMIFGYNKAELIGMNLKQLMSAEEYKTVLNQTENRKRGQSGKYEVEIIQKDGDSRIIKVYANPVINEEGSYSGAFAIFHDITEQKRIERKLEKKQEQLEIITDHLPLLIAYVDSEERYLYVNQPYADWYGCSKKEIIEKYIKEVVPADSYKGIIPNLRKVFRGEKLSFENISYDADGNLKAVRASYIPHFGNKKEVKAFVGVVEDITDRKQAKEKIHFQANILNCIKQAVIATDKNRKIVYANPAAEKLYGWQQEEMIGRTVNDLIGMANTPEINREIYERISKGKKWYGEFMLKNKRGKQFWAEVIDSPICDIDNNLSGIIEVSSDISIRKKVEQEMKRSYDRFKAIMDSIDLIVYVADMETYELLFVNKYTRDIFGDVEGKVCWQIFQGEQDGPCEFCTNKYLVEDGKPTDGCKWEFQNYKTGRWYQIYDRAIRWIDDRFVRMEIAIDITQIKEAEESLKESEQKLRRLNASKDKFFSIIAHDLKNPLGTLIGFSDLLSNHYQELTEEHRLRSIEGINSSARGLFDLLKNLLEWSRTQTGHIQYSPEMIDLHYIVNATVVLLNHEITEKNLLLMSEIKPGLMVYADVQMVTTVIRNLITNAIKFTDHGGHITIKAFLHDDFVQIVVNDNGVGIPPEHIDKLFRIDVSYSTEGTNKEKGTGLGLILCKEFVERNGGDIWVESTQGKGSKFTFTLPKDDTVIW